MQGAFVLNLILASVSGLAFSAAQSARHGPPRAIAVESALRTIDGPLGIVSDERCLELDAVRSASPSSGKSPVGVVALDAFASEVVIDLPIAPQARATAVRAEATAGHTNISARAIGVDAIASSSVEGFAYGVRGTANGIGFESVGVDGFATGGDYTIGVRGRTSGPTGIAVWADGELLVTGYKSFAQPHPGDPARMIQFCSLEGNESGTYFRATLSLRAGGSAEIAIPEAWQLASEAEGVSVQLTPVGAPARVWVVERSRERIVVASDLDCEVDVLVNGVRRGFAGFEPLRENRAFRPTVRGEPWGAWLPEGERKLLVENGTLRPDFTPDEATAAALGWTLADPAASPQQ